MKALFNKDFVKDNYISKDQAQVYTTIFAGRFEADCEDFFAVDKNDVQHHLIAAKEFILLVGNIINNSTNND